MPKKKSTGHHLKEQATPEKIDLPQFDIFAADLSLEDSGLAIVRCDTEHRKASIVRMELVHNKPHKSWPRGRKLSFIADTVADMLSSANVKAVARENSFVRFSQETIVLNMVNGVFEHFCWQCKEMTPYVISPLTVKKMVTGSGRASKEEVAEAIDNYCDHTAFKTNDVSDAVGVALCYLIMFDYIDQRPLDKYADKASTEF